MNGFPTLHTVLLSTGHGPAPWTFEWLVSTNVINIVLMFLLIGYFINKFNLFGVFDQRKEAIEKELDAVETAKKEALEQLEEVRTKTQNLEKEVASILSQAKASAESLSDQILENAQQEANRIVEASQKRIESEQRSAAKSLEARLLMEALDEARSELAQASTDEKSRSVEAFIAELPKIAH